MVIKVIKFTKNTKSLTYFLAVPIKNLALPHIKHIKLQAYTLIAYLWLRLSK